MTAAETGASPKTRWIIMALSMLTAMLVFTMPTISLSVLFSEISDDLNLGVVQIGVIWAVASLMGVVVGLIGGGVSDKIGTRRSLILICLFTGIFGGLRGISTGFYSFVFYSFLLGLFQQATPVNLSKIIGRWFPPDKLGTANGLLSAGFGAGLMLGSLLSASVLSPWLGGWRAVMYFYAGLAFVMCGLWFLFHPPLSEAQKTSGKAVSLRDSFSYVARLRYVWIVGLGSVGIRGCIAGFSGYLPTYLRDIGWSGDKADGALALFFLCSVICVVPISMLSDRFRARRTFMMGAGVCMALGVGLLFVADGALIWIAIMIAGFTFDGFMSIFNTYVLEVEGVGLAYAGTALGFAHMFRNMGGAISPPLGNSLTAYSLSAPFIFWSLLAILGVIVFAQLPRAQSRWLAPAGGNVLE
jgi:NNP family nitrate/nitrite transporter-like MFS transporter